MVHGVIFFFVGQTGSRHAVWHGFGGQHKIAPRRIAIRSAASVWYLQRVTPQDDSHLDLQQQPLNLEPHLVCLQEVWQPQEVDFPQVIILYI